MPWISRIAVLVGQNCSIPELFIVLGTRMCSNWPEREQEDLYEELKAAWLSYTLEYRGQLEPQLLRLLRKTRGISKLWPEYKDFLSDKDDPASPLNSDENQVKATALNVKAKLLVELQGWYGDARNQVASILEMERERSPIEPIWMRGYDAQFAKYDIRFNEVDFQLNWVEQQLVPFIDMPGMNPYKRALMDENGRLALSGWKKKMDEARKIRNNANLEEMLVSVADSPGNPFQARGWRPIDCVGRGGQGTVHIWGRYDENQNLRERICRKDMVFPKKDFYNTLAFRGSVRDGTAVPTEYALNVKCQEQPEAQNFLEMLNVEVGFDAGVCRLYSAFCPHRDLHEIISATVSKGDAKNPVNDGLPGPFLWYFLEALVACGLIMERGYVEDTEMAGDNRWDEIVHLDLKPSNIFLDKPSQRYQIYPTPRMADFGLAIETWATDPANPESYLHRGTTGYYAPEQLPFFDLRTGDPVDAFPIRRQTNVWQVGRIMYALIHGAEPGQLVYEAGRQPQYSCSNAAREIYGDALCDIVDGMMRWNPVERETFEGVRNTIESFAMFEDEEQQVFMRAARVEGYEVGEEEEERFGLPCWDAIAEKAKYKLWLQDPDERAAQGESGIVTPFEGLKIDLPGAKFSWE